MAFIEKSDLLAYIDAVELEEIIEGDDTNLTVPINDSLAHIKGRLAHRYDVDTIFANPSNADYATVKQVGVFLTLYFIYAKVQATHIPDYRREQYEDAKYWLHDWATGQWNYNLPAKVDESDETSNSGQGWTTSQDFLNSRY